MSNKEFIINSKLYSTEKSLLLCEASEPFGKALYYTEKGAFFTVEQITGQKNVKVISKQDALKILNENPADIINANYIKVFGNVENG
ncbi:MAG: hypothetical protein NC299_10655 [Lachnospiraceae bacterium]|nr:hypothetical protein [Ruminococcus sp.]MCM1275808.1 hypothetical protein [Lachnospiraceae bacterium]